MREVQRQRPTSPVTSSLPELDRTDRREKQAKEQGRSRPPRSKKWHSGESESESEAEVDEVSEQSEQEGEATAVEHSSDGRRRTRVSEGTEQLPVGVLPVGMPTPRRPAGSPPTRGWKRVALKFRQSEPSTVTSSASSGSPQAARSQGKGVQGQGAPRRQAAPRITGSIGGKVIRLRERE